jgi:hypothetical protein
LDSGSNGNLLIGCGRKSFIWIQWHQDQKGGEADSAAEDEAMMSGSGWSSP